MNSQITLFNTEQLPPNNLVYCKQFTDFLEDQPTANYKYSFLFIKDLLNENLPVKVQKFFNFISENNISEHLTTNCIGKFTIVPKHVLHIS